jgi:hypothetical protein
MALALIVGVITYYKIDTRLTNLLMVIIGYMPIQIWMVVEQRAKRKAKIKTINYLKSKNLITVVEVHSDSFYLLEEDDDEGVFYLFQLPDNKILSFGGQDFYEDERFPNNNFEIVEGRGINNEILIYEVYIHGDKIQPKKIISGKEKWDLLNSKDYPNPEKLTVVDGKIEDYISNCLY